MRTVLAAILLLFSAATLYALENTTPAPVPAGKVLVVKVDGVIGPVSAEFISRGIERAGRMGAEAVVIELDTPGGLMDSMRMIIKDMISSSVPVVVYVSPSGGRAASAGAFITIAAHVAAMAPQTNIGAAHPVGAGGDSMDETMSAKATNDAVAYIKSLAIERGRNAIWAEDAVRNSVSATAEEALKLGVIDVVAESLPHLLAKIDGRKVKTVMGERTLHTSGAETVRQEMGTRHRILDFISNPNVAYLLMILGFYGLFFEMTNPGALFPGIVGGICLILAFYSFQTLPVNYAGVLLILLALVLFALETQIVSHGALTIGGLVAMVLGSLMLFEGGGPEFKVSLGLILATTLTTAAFFLLVVGLVVKAHRRQPVTGNEGLVGLEAAATSDINPDGGTVFVRGENWSAWSDDPIAKGGHVIVEAAQGLRLKVRKKPTGG